MEPSKFNVKLSPLHRDVLEEPVTNTEVLAAIQYLKSSKTPGRDRLPAEFYKRFRHILVDSITDLCNALLTYGTMPLSWKEARIIVLPKKGKDLTNVASYRPISLLNLNVKIFTTIMAK